MISKENILDLQMRREIYDFILKNPGLHERELSRRIEMPKTTLRYHINYLMKYDLVVIKPDGGYSRFYVTQKVGKRDKEILNLLRQETPRKIVIMLLTPGPGDIFIDKETRREAYKKPETYFKTYSKKELIELTKHWHGPNVSQFRLDKHYTTIDFHLRKMLDADLIEKVKVGREKKYRLKDEDMIWAFLIKYQKALSTKSINLYLSWQNEGWIRFLDNILDGVYEILPHPYHP